MPGLYHSLGQCRDSGINVKKHLKTHPDILFNDLLNERDNQLFTFVLPFINSLIIRGLNQYYNI